MVKVDDKEKILCADDRRDSKINQFSLAAMNTGQTQTLHRPEKIESKSDRRKKLTI
ncbi:hypothetical protein GALMADRAFT_240755 [Galerina marginata CBS 339.88]|uniref:Uncharacterized protein n=1 Tax=Galerina marginata (strain CBS 339.88) TaxID=685588 RepID=A0A067TTD2_GALM3|nr:hypothetical protein GALMADRAFT_240755 [Galerina marginata CBS 339.88]